MSASRSLKDRLKGLYAITDQRLIATSCFDQAIELALQGGTRILQYRDKSADNEKRLQQARVLCSLCREYDAVSIINDDIELASEVDADGIHLGEDDSSIAEARQKLGQDAIIGVSCYDQIDLAIDAEKTGADYVAFGAMFTSPTKPQAISTDPGIISEAKHQISIPVCSIGGITSSNIQQLIDQDTDMAAVISSLFSASDIKKSAIELSKHFV